MGSMSELNVLTRIADALERIADNGDKIAGILDDIGMNNYTPAGPPGALEMIGIELKEIREVWQAMHNE